MFKQVHKSGIVLLIMAVFLSACGYSRATPTVTPTLMDPNAVFTAAAQTAEARRALTATAQPTATSEPTVTATATLALTSTPAFTGTLPAAVTPTGAAVIPTQPSGGGADNAVWVEDITVPDGTDFAPGASFVKTWRILNTGTSTWNTTYSLVHISGDRLGGPETVALTVEVPPGQQVDLSVSMVAPTATGNYKSFWRMRTPNGTFFGDSLYADIDVVASGGTSPTATPTGTTGGGTLISNVSITASESSATAPCPHEFAFTGSFTLSQAATVTYEFEAGSDAGWAINLPAPVTVPLTPGTYSYSLSLSIENTGSGWVRFHISAPENVTSNRAEFSLTCQN